MKASPPLEIQLLGKEYQVACPPEQRSALQAAAALLNMRLTEAADKGKVRGERLAVMVALNLAHELLAKNSDSFTASGSDASALDSDELARKIRAIESRIDGVLNKN